MRLRPRVILLLVGLTLPTFASMTGESSRTRGPDIPHTADTAEASDETNVADMSDTADTTENSDGPNKRNTATGTMGNGNDDSRGEESDNMKPGLETNFCNAVNMQFESIKSQRAALEKQKVALEEQEVAMKAQQTVFESQETALNLQEAKLNALLPTVQHSCEIPSKSETPTVSRGLAEKCQDGNSINGDGCNSDGVVERCGNGKVGYGEQCDDGNHVLNDGCDNYCRIGKWCGNGIVERDQGETCEPTDFTNSSDSCNNFCRAKPELTCEKVPYSEIKSCRTSELDRGNVPFITFENITEGVSLVVLQENGYHKCRLNYQSGVENTLRRLPGMIDLMAMAEKATGYRYWELRFEVNNYRKYFFAVIEHPENRSCEKGLGHVADVLIYLKSNVILGKNFVQWYEKSIPDICTPRQLFFVTELNNEIFIPKLTRPSFNVDLLFFLAKPDLENSCKEQSPIFHWPKISDPNLRYHYVFVNTGCLNNAVSRIPREYFVGPIVVHIAKVICEETICQWGDTDVWLECTYRNGAQVEVGKNCRKEDCEYTIRNNGTTCMKAGQ